MSLRPKFGWRSAAAVGATLALALSACATDEPSEPTNTFTEISGTLKLGTILPQTGSLAFLGPPEFAGVNLAIKDINAAGGVWGSDVTVHHTDSSDASTDIASQSAETLVAEGVQAVIGAASSSVSLSFIDKLYQSKVIQISPANTSPVFTDHPSGEYYFRTAPSDVLQGRVLSDLILEDGHEKLGILALQDSYGTGLLKYTKEPFIAGGGQVVLEEVYDPTSKNFSDQVAKVAEAQPDALAIISFDEFLTLAPALINANLGPDVIPWYLVDGNLANYSGKLPDGALEGVKGTTPGADTSAEFKARLAEVDANLNNQYSYAPESYDATVLIALAAIAANSTDTEAIKNKLVDVSTGGKKVTTFAEGKAALLAGEDIDYDGVSGPVEWDAAGDPTAAYIGIYQYAADNTYSPLKFLFGEL